MIPKDKKRFAQALALMGEAFQKQPTDPQTELYWKVLQDMDIETFEAACLRLINTRTITGTFPLIAEIRAIDDTPLDTRAAIAWDKFAYALQYHCPYDSVSFDDPIIIHIIQTWGDWPSMGDWDTSETHFWRKEFMKLYQAFAKSNNPPKTPEYLIGLTEYENSKKGFLEFIPKPFLIGMNSGEIKAIAFNPQVLKRISHQKEIP